MQPQYRDNLEAAKELRKLHEDGKLADDHERFWFGRRSAEELYDLHSDPDQIHNLANDPKHQDTLEKYRSILDQWIVKTNDQGQTPEDSRQLKATYDLWKNKEIVAGKRLNPEFDQFKSTKH